ncbi:MAG: GSU2403 family nucleotidyltransferase fold protein [Pseudomonadota bacterium]
MERQNKLVVEILKKLEKEGILSQVLLIGSWCIYFYKDYFKGINYYPRIKTRDIDFLVPARPKFPKEVDLEKLLSSLGFEIEFFGKGYMKLESEELMLEFLVPEIGRSKDKPFPLKQLHFNAQPLRHLSMLWRDPIQVNVAGIKVKLPHPADCCLQKVIAASKRKQVAKADKDKQSAISLLEALIEKKDFQDLSAAYKYLSKAEQKVVRAILVKEEFENFQVFE